MTGCQTPAAIRHQYNKIRAFRTCKTSVFPSPQRQVFGQATCWSSTPLHIIWSSSSLSLIQAQATWVTPMNVSISSTRSFPRLKPAVTSHHGLAWPLPRCFTKSPATLPGLVALGHGGTCPALWTLVHSNITCQQLRQSLQLSNSPSLSLRHTQEAPSELSLKWTVWNNDSHSRRKKEKLKNNKGSTDWNRTL